ncbi:TOBE domain-containing protein [Heyndrickxia oleronia]|nr:TOBE domain-containing protein [Heyndrickxia oleronia]
MNEGCIEQVDDPTTIYNHPKTDFVSKFIGEVNQVQGNVLETFENNVCKISFYGNEQFVPVQTSGNKEMSFFIRPERIKISQEEGGNSFQTRVERKIFLGSKTRYILNVKEKKLIADISNTELNPHHIEEGENVYTYWEPEDLLPSKEVS